MAKIRLKNAGKLVAGLIRGIAETMEIRVRSATDLKAPREKRRIWVFWHNRMFILPWVKHTRFPGEIGAVLSSPSGDGGVIAETCAEFGLDAVRGSSSRRGARAMVEMAGLIEQGYDLAITPDGPRGPRYQLNPGIIKLAQLTGAEILPVHVHYHRAFRLRTWDGFLVPLPFSNADVEFGEPRVLPRRMTEDECEAERVKLERLLIEGTDEG